MPPPVLRSRLGRAAASDRGSEPRPRSRRQAARSGDPLPVRHRCRASGAGLCARARSPARQARRGRRVHHDAAGLRRRPLERSSPTRRRSGAVLVGLFRSPATRTRSSCTTRCRACACREAIRERMRRQARAHARAPRACDRARDARTRQGSRRGRLRDAAVRALRPRGRHHQGHRALMAAARAHASCACLMNARSAIARRIALLLSAALRRPAPAFLRRAAVHRSGARAVVPEPRARARTLDSRRGAHRPARPRGTHQGTVLMFAERPGRVRFDG